MLTLFLRTFVLYGIMLLTLRGMGKHQLGQFQPYEFAMAMLIADLVATPMSDVSTPLFYGVLPVAALFIIHVVISVACMKSDRARAILSGKPSVIVSGGVINEKELCRLCLSLSDLMEGLRVAGILDPKEAGTAVHEANGSISAFPAAQSRPPTTSEMNVTPEPEGMPLFLIMDGRVQKNNWQVSGRGEDWLAGLLRPYNLRAKDVFLASLDKAGSMRVQDKNGAVLTLRAMTPEEAGW